MSFNKHGQKSKTPAEIFGNEVSRLHVLEIIRLWGERNTDIEDQKKRMPRYISEQLTRYSFTHSDGRKLLNPAFSMVKANEVIKPFIEAGYVGNKSLIYPLTKTGADHLADNRVLLESSYESAKKAPEAAAKKSPAAKTAPAPSKPENAVESHVSKVKNSVPAEAKTPSNGNGKKRTSGLAGGILHEHEYWFLGGKPKRDERLLSGSRKTKTA